MVGFDTSKALAGLGIGGIVVGFALQKTLTDIFGTLALLADGNFTTGDFIILGNGERGEVLQIGFRTTRIQSLEDGEILCIPNSKLSSEIVKNQDAMRRRRVKIAIEVEKSTPLVILRSLPDAFEQVVRSVNNAKFGNCHFMEITYTGYEIDIIFYVEGADVATFKRAKEGVNFGILKLLESLKVHTTSPVYGVDASSRRLSSSDR